ncbi:MAG: hypothetical protein ACRDRG_07085 [Pseudonocardiaceae bacterium]
MGQERRDRTDTVEPELARRITPPVLRFLVLGVVLGTGIYALIGSVAGRAGGFTWVAFVLALALAGATVPAYAELATKYPRAAGAALYVRPAFNRPLLTFLVGVFVLRRPPPRFKLRCWSSSSASTMMAAWLASVVLWAAS